MKTPLVLNNEELRHLNNLSKMSYDLKMPKTYLVGGIIRDSILNHRDTNDLDITVNDGFKSIMLGLCYGSKNNLKMKYKYNKNLSIFLSDCKTLDFSSGSVSRKVDRKFNKLKAETLSRDFTINSLLFNIHDENIIDITRKGISDCLDRKLNTILDPSITFGDDPKRIFRAIFYATKYNLEISSDIYDYLINNKSLISQTIKNNESFIINAVAKSLNNNEDLTIEFLQEINSLQNIPLVGKFKNILIKRKLLDFYLKNEERQENSIIDPIGGFDGSEYPKYFGENAPSSVPSDGTGTKDDNNINMYRQLPHFT